MSRFAITTRLFATATIVLFVLGFAGSAAADSKGLAPHELCSSTTVTECSHSLTYAANQDGKSLRLDANWRDGDMLMTFDDRDTVFSIAIRGYLVANDPMVTVTYNGTVSVFTASDVVASGGDVLVAATDTIDVSTLTAVHEMLATIPDDSPHLFEAKGLAQTILTSVDYPSLAEKATGVDYIAYSVCWYGCMLGGGHAVACGDYCAGRYL